MNVRLLLQAVKLAKRTRFDPVFVIAEIHLPFGGDLCDGEGKLELGFPETTTNCSSLQKRISDTPESLLRW